MRDSESSADEREEGTAGDGHPPHDMQTRIPADGILTFSTRVMGMRDARVPLPAAPHGPDLLFQKWISASFSESGVVCGRSLRTVRQKDDDADCRASVNT